MDKTIENKFFAEFQNGAAAMCIKYVKDVIANNGENLDEQLRRYYSAFPAEVAKRTKDFDDSAWPINIVGEYRIAQEISDNLDKCVSDNERDRYLNSILQVFEEWANVFTPIPQLQMLDKMLHKARKGLSLYTKKEIKREIERVSNQHDRFLDIMHNAAKGTIEAYFEQWYDAYYHFCEMLAAICAEHNINLLEVQNKRGIWLISKLDVMQIQYYFGYTGNFNYANNLLKTLPRTSATEHLIHTEHDGVINSEVEWHRENADATTDSKKIDEKLLPIELATEKALRYFKIAIERGLIERMEDVFLWKGETTVLLELFCGIIYCDDEIIPSKRCKDEWHLGVAEFPSAALSRIFPTIKNIGQQRNNNLITPHKGKRYRYAPKGWETIIGLFD